MKAVLHGLENGNWRGGICLIKTEADLVASSDIMRYNVLNKLLQNVDVINDCWNWTGSLFRNQYPRMSVGTVSFLARRVSYVLHFGECQLPVIRTDCGNKLCINPDHLYGSRPGRNTGSSIDRFWSRVDKTATCWLWTGALHGRDGRGYIRHEGGRYFVHRFSYWLHYGDFDQSLFVCHHCDVPHCVRPDHLFLGTAKDNSQDAAQKGRLGKTKGEASPKSVLTVEQVLQIRERYLTEGPKKLAAEFGVYEGTPYEIYIRKTWKHI